MTRDELWEALDRAADDLDDVDLTEAAWRQGSSMRRRRQTLTTSGLVTGGIAAAVIAFALLGGGQATGPDTAPAVTQTDDGALTSTDGPVGATCGSPRPPLPVLANKGEGVVDAQKQWIDQLPDGPPPLTPWWHDGVLHVNGEQLPWPSTPTKLVVAGGTVLVGVDQPDQEGGVALSQWALVRDGKLEPLPEDAYAPDLGVDGSLAYWWRHQGPVMNAVVIWDVLAQEELTSWRVPEAEADGVEVLGIDANGVAYLRDWPSGQRVTEWDVREGTRRQSELTWDSSRSYMDQCPPLGDLPVWTLEWGYVSPDGTRQVFTGPAPGDASEECCMTLLRVRPADDIGSVDPEDISGFALPEGIPHASLWDPYNDRGTWGVWWESDETVLLDAVVDRHSYLVRCPTDGGTCERVFDLGPSTTSLNRYQIGWEQGWAFARSPLTE